MKNKISFTSVLKSKGGRNFNLPPTESQYRSMKLIDLYQEFQTNPNKAYTLELNGFKLISQKSRNSSIGMVKSNHTNQDPEMNLDDWVEQNRSNYQSIVKGPPQKSIRETIPYQQDSSQGRRSRSNFNKNPNFIQQEDEQNSYHSNQMMENSQRYEKTQMEQSKRSYHRNAQKPSLHFQSQASNEVQPERAVKPRLHQYEKQPIGPEEFLIQEQLKPKSHFPSLDDQDYKKLQEEFQKLKQQKITELCMQTKKSIKKQKLEQIISKALQNIYEEIEQMAEQIIAKRKIQTDTKRKQCQEEVSEEMLISGCNDYIQQQELNQSLEAENREGQERRKQDMKNKIKGLIEGIHEAKSQGKASTSFQSSKGLSKNESSNHFSGHNQNDDESQQPSFNYNSNTFSNQVNQYNEKPNQSFGSRKVNTAKHSIPDSVGYSFANSNMACEHSFNKEVMDHNQFQNQYHYGDEHQFHKNHANPPIYEPQNSDHQEEEQRISLPNIEEVKSDCGDFLHEQLESSEAIECKRNKMQNLAIDVSGNNIKNIQSVHYEPPIESYGYQTYKTQTDQKQLFKNFEQPYYKIITQDTKSNTTYERKQPSFIEKDEILKEQIIPSHQEQKFVSKTFSSYLSGEMRSEYGQAIREVPKSPNDQANSSKQSGFGYKIQPSNTLNRYSPSISKETLEKNVILSTRQIQLQSIQSISSPRNQNFAFMNNTNSSQGLGSSKLKNQSMMNESSHLSLNNSFNQPSGRVETGSSKNIHQLQSKNKFSINSPMNKIEEMMSNEEKQRKETTITQFNGFGERAEITHQFTKIPSASNSYAISSPIGNYKLNDSTVNEQSYGQQNMPRDHNYACAQSIAQSASSKVGASMNQPLKSQQNSILSMQPLKLSDKKTGEAENITIKSNQSQNVAVFTAQRNSSINPINQTNNQISKTQSSQNQISSSNITDGRMFLQSLHEKQSIEIQMSPETKKQLPSEKNSFVAQTFRPTVLTTQQPVKPTVILNDYNSINSNQKIARVITLRSSDRNAPTSPKVISLSINPVHQKTQNTANIGIQNKENVFEKLTIKQSKNFDNSTGIKVNLASSINQPLKSTAFSNFQHHIDMNSKENNNTMNNSSTNIDYKQQLTSHHKSSVTSATEKREPLLKLSKNFGNPPTLQTVNTANVKKSIGESIKTKVHPISSLASSKGFSMAANVKQSIKNVKESIGNDSDMDFDIELD